MKEIKKMTIQESINILIEYRLDSLGLLKTMDRVGVDPAQLDASLMNAWADVDAEILQVLALSTKMPADEQIPDHHTSELLQGIEKGKQIKLSLINRLPRRYRKKVKELLPVGKLVVDEDDVYAELAEYLPAITSGDQLTK